MTTMEIILSPKDERYNFTLGQQVSSTLVFVSGEVGLRLEDKQIKVCG